MKKIFLFIKVGSEIGVTATKAYIPQLVSIYLFANILASNDEMLMNLEKNSRILSETLNKEKDINKQLQNIRMLVIFSLLEEGCLTQQL